ncbi:MAG TPA: penicillin-binding transpeptidase domain-containing protein [Candidatus Dormibacteraeota bacterium]|nr:penicillin-binding transpeptidase domain-containing protein [Candidatus Dormibacteraeota bacterium]
MNIKKYLSLLLALLVLVEIVCAQSSSPKNVASHTLFAQSAIRILERDFPKNDASFLLLDAKSGALLAQRWDNYEKPIPLGSLIKPFTALAYASAHDFRYPKYECRGKISGCWQDRPHGILDLIAAISVSCNSYFRQMAQNVTEDQINQTTREFGLESPDTNFESQNLAGLGDRWRLSPLHTAQAYIELYRRKEQPGVNEILQGMRQSALRGTGMAVGRQLKHTKALVKTGTAPCTHTPWAPADGFTMVMLPAEDPEILLMVRIHSVTGATTAETAGKLLRQMEE